MKIGIVGGSMKPVTKGHWSLIDRASKENDRVVVFVSSTDRGGRNDEALIRADDMSEVWERYLMPFLPPNVAVKFGGSPIRKIYELLGEANESGSVDEFVVYSDPVDIETRFGIEKQEKYFKSLLMHEQVKFIGVDRMGENDVSASQLRVLLNHGMRDAFISLLPESVDTTGIWQFLLLKTYMRRTNEDESTTTPAIRRS